MSAKELLAAFCGHPCKDLCGFVDPFTSKAVDHIDIRIGRKLFTQDVEASATVWFNTDMTRGQHTIAAPTLEALLPKLHSFIGALK